MGEYAKHNGQEVKIGTCENMYYLRDDQRNEIDGYGFDEETLGVIRFRFPFPDEDENAPGDFDDYARGVRVPGYSLPAELSGDEHHQIQFTSTAGYNLCIPCPEQYGDGERPDGLKVHRNGFNGHPVVRQQAHRGGHLVTLLSCNACGALHRLDTAADAAPVAEAFLNEAERQDYSPHHDTPNNWGYANSEQQRRFLTLMARRIMGGYEVTA